MKRQKKFWWYTFCPVWNTECPLQTVRWLQLLRDWWYLLLSTMLSLSAPLGVSLRLQPWGKLWPKIVCIYMNLKMEERHFPRILLCMQATLTRWLYLCKHKEVYNTKRYERIMITFTNIEFRHLFWMGLIVHNRAVNDWRPNGILMHLDNPPPDAINTVY